MCLSTHQRNQSVPRSKMSWLFTSVRTLAWKHSSFLRCYHFSELAMCCASIDVARCVESWTYRTQLEITTGVRRTAISVQDSWYNHVKTVVKGIGGRLRCSISCFKKKETIQYLRRAYCLLIYHAWRKQCKTGTKPVITSLQAWDADLRFIRFWSLVAS